MKNLVFIQQITKMKKNLLFALSVFLITIVGLLVFADSSNTTKKETSEVEIIDKSERTELSLLDQ